jgi:hypothetical protein
VLDRQGHFLGLVRQVALVGRAEPDLTAAGRPAAKLFYRDLIDLPPAAPVLQRVADDDLLCPDL